MKLRDNAGLTSLINETDYPLRGISEYFAYETEHFSTTRVKGLTDGYYC
jgi:hypothetical protein